jgi:hypothetical protein
MVSSQSSEAKESGWRPMVQYGVGGPLSLDALRFEMVLRRLVNATSSQKNLPFAPRAVPRNFWDHPRFALSSALGKPNPGLKKQTIPSP